MGSHRHRYYKKKTNRPFENEIKREKYIEKNKFKIDLLKCSNFIFILLMQPFEIIIGNFLINFVCYRRRKYLFFRFFGLAFIAIKYQIALFFRVITLVFEYQKIIDCMEDDFKAMKTL